MAGREMTRYGIILGVAASFALFSQAESQTIFVSPPMSVSALDDAVNPGPRELPLTPVKPPVAAATKTIPTGNPLWAVPLKALSVTRERPIFSPSRRPPPPVVVGLPPEPVRPRVVQKPAEPERPRLALVGTVTGEAENIAVFLDEATKEVVRLKAGENHTGWILRSVTGREVVLQKDSETAILALPTPAGDKLAPSRPSEKIPNPNEPEL
jgi:general secretion pathway protein N